MKIMRLALTALFWIGLLVAAPAQTTLYVATNGTGGGTSWADATSNLQGAIDAISGAYTTNTVWVSNGVYEAGGVTNFPTGTLLTNRVAIYKAITVRSKDNDPTNTIIKGAWDPTSTNGPAAVRCVWMTNGSTLIGFTLTNGATTSYGGGVYCQSTNTVISNCVLTGNSAYYYGGGAYYGTLFNCTLTRNSATYNNNLYGGGGTYGGTLNNCTLSYNSAASLGQGGGAMYGTLTNCTIVGNSAKYGGGTSGGNLYNCTIVSNSAVGYGGGTYEGNLYNCTLIGNSSASLGGASYFTIMNNCTLIGNSAWAGGGAEYGTLYNCTIASNSASYGGGAYGGTFYNCTLVRNTQPYYGGGVIYGTLYNCKLIGNRTYWGGDNGGGGAYNCTLYNCTVSGNSSEYPAGVAGHGGGVRGGSLINCIVYGNTALTSGRSNWYAVAVFTNTCTVPAATNGVGNITDNPLFIDPGSGSGTNHVAGNYRLRNISPPLNAGMNFSWMTVSTNVHSKDLDGQRRIDRYSGQVDMGCYELMPAGTLFMIGQ